MIQLGNFRFGIRKGTVRLIGIGTRCAVIGYIFWAGMLLHGLLGHSSSTIYLIMLAIGSICNALFFTCCGVAVMDLNSAQFQVASEVDASGQLQKFRTTKDYAFLTSSAFVLAVILYAMPLGILYTLRLQSPLLMAVTTAVAVALMLWHSSVLISIHSSVRKQYEKDENDVYRLFDWTKLESTDEERFRKRYGKGWKSPSAIDHPAEADQYASDASGRRYGFLATSFIVGIVVAVVVQPVLADRIRAIYYVFLHPSTPAPNAWQYATFAVLLVAALSVLMLQQQAGRYERLEKLYEDRAKELRVSP